MQPRPIMLSLLLALLSLPIIARPVHAQTGVDLRIVNNGGVYEVYMRPTFTPTDKNTLTAQITIKVPHGTGADRFQPQPEPSAANYVGDIAGPTWTIGSRTDGPTEDGTADYISWDLNIGADASVYNWTAGQEVLAFRLTNAGNCLGALALMADGDAFNTLPNSANTNPGNEIALNEINFGVTNAYIGTYGGAANCVPPTITPGQSFTVADSAPNGTTVGTVAASDPDSASLTFSISAGNPGGDAFAIDSSSGLITVNNSGSLPALGTAVPLTINVVDGTGGSDSQTVTITIASPLVQLKVLLQGAYDPASGLMRDDLRAANLLPDQEPYTAMPSYSHLLSGGGETVSNPTTVFADNGLNSIVDWVFVELRDAAAPGTVVATRAGLLQRDGDVVEVNGSSPLLFSQVPTGSYYVGVRHRNHLGAMTKTAIALTATGVAVDFSDTSVDYWESSSLFQAREQIIVGGNYALWAGDADADQKVVFAGQNNDIDAIFNAVDQAPLNLFGIQTYILSGYYLTDINLDGKVIFAGQNNDLDVIFNIVTGHPGNVFRLQTFTIPQQMAQ